MKAKELIKILEKNPDYIVCFETYTGCETPIMGVTKAIVYKKGDRVEDNRSTSTLVQEVPDSYNGRAKKNIIQLLNL